MNWLKKLFGAAQQSANAILKYFSTGKAAQDCEIALGLVGAALPYIKIAGDIVTKLIPGEVDDRVWAAIQTKFPALFRGEKLTSDELKLYTLAVATEILQQKFNIDLSTARAAAQNAYLDYRALPEALRP